MAEGRFFAAAGTALFALALLAGCSGGTSTPGTPNPAGPPPAATPPPAAPTGTPAGVACPTTPTNVAAANNITLNLAVTRNSGVGPLAVFFDASGSSATTVPAGSRAFREIQYGWAFGEAAGIWNYTYGATKGSRNLATGPLAAHIFEPPVGGGTQTWNVTVTATINGTDMVTYNCDITATDPDDVFAANTLCVSVSPGNFTDCPAGATTLVSNDFDAVINDVSAQGATYKRILFRRGETFTSSEISRITADGPGYVGVFGAGNARAQISGATDKIALGNSSNHDFADWRIVDLDLNGLTTTNGDGAGAGGAASRITFLRCVFRNLDIGVELPLPVLDSINVGSTVAPMWQEWAFFDNVFIGLQSYGFLGALNYAMWVNNQMTGQETQHGIRFIYTRKAVLTNNEATGTSSGTALTIRGANMNPALRLVGNQFTLPANSYTEHVVVTDNKLNSGLGQFAFTIVPPSFDDDTRFRDFLLERNWFILESGSNLAFESQAGEQTIRNNVFNLTNAGGAFVAIALVKAANTPADAGDNVLVYNNTAYSGRVSNLAFVFLDIRASPAGVIARNNLGYAPNTSPGSSVMFRGGAGNVYSNNTGNVGSLTTNPGFANLAFTSLSHWVANGYGRNAGVSPPSGALPVVDIAGNVRPAGAGTDIGATELP